MQIPRSSHTAPSAAVNHVLRIAKQLHRAATSESLAQALPVLRRLLDSGTLNGLSLPELHRRRQSIQRKHILRMLAIEAGHPSWEIYKPVLANKATDELDHFDIIRRQAGYPNLWFSSLAEAQQYATQHGGRALPVRHQAVVIPEK